VAVWLVSWLGAYGLAALFAGVLVDAPVDALE
jgi:hypothetical protein